MTQQDSSQFVFVPLNRLVAAINSPDEACSAMTELTEKGIPVQDSDVLIGMDGLQKFDFDGSRHGVLARFARFIQRIADLETQVLECHMNELKQGHALITVPAADATTRQQALDIIKKHGAHTIYYFSPLATEQLY
jgi:hypothetical protein